ncbi:adenosylcobinamide-phosphate synthase CbiB [Niallia sp. Sow4_A1]|uniref:Cobalamin biosynthesis protein CobD n=1 Tax=Niallia hominis TaxID=3133173 RepID=A0ABV1EXZ8_9BACI|nr:MULTISPECIES: adenosylcobinamide-phosphate synthase CbiB [Bacillaceae]MCM3361350.1 adenosylcobinamide-phosphate synthase CbiB [Niallia sp. MER TA 168]CAI9395694.1 Cobalamin biosynthesis protein CobD [Bacillus sp. T2.9-1]
MIGHLISITLAIVLDKLIGDPPSWPHPVKGMGRLISFLDQRLNNGKSRRIKGLWMLSTVLIFTFLISYVLVYISYQLHWWVGVIVEALLIATTIAQKSLKDAAIEVYDPLQANDLEMARKKLSYIVGRDTEQLEGEEIVRATVETVAENTSDGITAPLFWAFIGGAPLSLVYRAINTCDSMVGYKNDKYGDFGYCAAKCDDIVNYLPSRITAILVLLVSRSPFYRKKEAWKLLFHDAMKHPSPNSGWGEAVTAIILGIQLGGINFYKGKKSDRARMGRALQPLGTRHIIESTKIADKAVVCFYLFLCIGGIGFELANAWS